MLVGFGGAVEDGVRSVGTLVALVVAVVLGWAYGSVLVGVGAFVAGVLMATLFARHAGQAFRERQSREGRDGP